MENEKKTFDIDPLSNLLLNMGAGLLPEQLTGEEIDMLEGKFGPNWFEKLGYNEKDYRKPT